jgi:hypothetical protein
MSLEALDQAIVSLTEIARHIANVRILIVDCGDDVRSSVTTAIASLKTAVIKLENQVDAMREELKRDGAPTCLGWDAGCGCPACLLLDHDTARHFLHEYVSKGSDL